ncbi:MAG: hypothetical protein A4E34_02639 [Methanoregula sp. PtaU1.Bin006]|nr:MAG: hypothetical protein A4E33_00389 [Methanoregula sp. PtaB.Bin085]OPY32265.1 MAG: hypothetical protein A4E34_02639 [Methanoregula sp. PtaU1.Bin006]
MGNPLVNPAHAKGRTICPESKQIPKTYPFRHPSSTSTCITLAFTVTPKR